MPYSIRQSTLHYTNPFKFIITTMSFRYNDNLEQINCIHRAHHVHCAHHAHRIHRDVVPNDPPMLDWRHFTRNDPFEDLNDREFMEAYRFTKQAMHRLVSELLP